MTQPDEDEKIKPAADVFQMRAVHQTRCIIGNNDSR